LSFASESPYSLPVPNPKFQVWESNRLLSCFYTSTTKDLSITDTKKISDCLSVPFGSVWFAKTHEAIDSLQLPKEATFENDGRKFWL
jgi:hypothetical protein